MVNTKNAERNEIVYKHWVSVLISKIFFKPILQTIIIMIITIANEPTINPIPKFKFSDKNKNPNTNAKAQPMTNKYKRNLDPNNIADIKVKTDKGNANVKAKNLSISEKEGFPQKSLIISIKSDAHWNILWKSF